MTRQCMHSRNAGMADRAPPYGIAALVLACLLALPAAPALAGQTASGAISGASAAASAAAVPDAPVPAAAASASTAPDAAATAAPAAATPEQQAALAGARPAAPMPMPMPAAPSASGSLLQTTLSLLLVLAILVGLAWLLKRFGPKSITGNAHVKLVGALSVGARERILVVEVGEQWIVVGASPGRMNALATMPRQEAASDLPASVSTSGTALPSANFAEWFKQTIEKRNGK